MFTVNLAAYDISSYSKYLVQDTKHSYNAYCVPPSLPPPTLKCLITSTSTNSNSCTCDLYHYQNDHRLFP